jgi:NAD(P)-dependent dehydrogenase (short-subunit alcohol dehydrogenase family)
VSRHLLCAGEKHLGAGRRRADRWALEAIAASLRDELAPTGITVQTINPGAFTWGFRR